MNPFQREDSIIVRNRCGTVFPVQRDTLDPLSGTSYDPYAYTDPLPGKKYMEYGDWLLLRRADGKETTW